MTDILAYHLAAAETAPAPARIATRDIGGIMVAALSTQGALAELSDAIASGRHVKLAFCNAHLVNLAAHESSLREQLAGFLILPDGIGVDLGSLLLHGAAFPANLNGTDFTPALLAAEPGTLRVALVGGKPGVAERAAAKLAQDYPRHRFEAVSHGFFTPAEEVGVLARLAAARPDLVLVAFGNPLQERWIAQKLTARHGTVVAGVGALFDFLAGEVPRAPGTFRELRLEWLYRLWLEPGRLWRRYVIGNPVFLMRVLGQRLRRLGGRRTS